MPAVAAILDSVFLGLRQVNNTTTSPASNSTSLALDKTLQCPPLPYGFIGIVLQLITYYSYFCILDLQLSPCLLVFRCRRQQLQRHVTNACLCWLSICTASGLMVAILFSAYSYDSLVLFTTVKLVMAIVCAHAIGIFKKHLHMRSPRTLSEHDSSLECHSLELLILMLLACEVLGLISFADVLRANWDKPLMKAACIGPVALLGVGALVLAGNLAWNKHRSIQTLMTVARVMVWVSGVIFLGMALVPLHMDAVLAVRAESWWGTPLSRDGNIIAMYVGYVVACLLPFFCT